MAETDESVVEEARRIFGLRMRGDGLSLLVLLVNLGVFALPGLSIKGVISETLWEMSVGQLLSFSTVATLLFFCAYYPDRGYWYLGILPGLFTGPLIILVAAFCSDWPDCPWFVHSISALVVGGLPGFILWYLPLKWLAIRGLKKEILHERAAAAEQCIDLGEFLVADE